MKSLRSLIKASQAMLSSACTGLANSPWKPTVSGRTFLGEHPEFAANSFGSRAGTGGDEGRTGGSMTRCSGNQQTLTPAPHRTDRLPLSELEGRKKMGESVAVFADYFKDVAKVRLVDLLSDSPDWTHGGDQISWGHIERLLENCFFSPRWIKFMSHWPERFGFLESPGFITHTATTTGLIRVKWTTFTYK